MYKTKKILIIADPQNDFIDGSLGSKYAIEVANKISKLILSEKWDEIIVKCNIHDVKTYNFSIDAKNNIPKHCTLGSRGYEIYTNISNALCTFGLNNVKIFNSECFGCHKIFGYLNSNYNEYNLDISICGFCTDNSVLTFGIGCNCSMHDANVVVLKDYCSGSTKQLHYSALDILKSNFVDIK